jgi:hypothetical protein
MNFPPRAGRVSGRATPYLCHARREIAKDQPWQQSTYRGTLFKLAGPALSTADRISAARFGYLLEGIDWRMPQKNLASDGGRMRIVAYKSVRL